METLNFQRRLGTGIISVRGTGKLRCILARTPRNFVLQRLGPVRSRKTMTEKVLRSALRSFQSERWEGYPDSTEDTIDIHGAAIPYTYSDQYPSPHDPPLLPPHPRLRMRPCPRPYRSVYHRSRLESGRGNRARIRHLSR
jgi:hypothetical protein